VAEIPPERKKVTSDMAKVKLLFTQTRYDQSNMWTECREVEVDLPDWITEKCDNFEWHITGMIKEGLSDDKT